MKLLDTQKYSECQLVALINAAAFLGEPPVVQDSEEYERLVDFVGARHGAAISAYKAVEYLRLQAHAIEPVTLQAVRTNVMAGHPVAVSVWHVDTGFHRILLTHGDQKGTKCWNFRIKQNSKGRVTWGRLREFMAEVGPAKTRKAEWYELDPLRKREKA